MTAITKWLRKNIGLVTSSVGMLLLVILTFGDIGELFTDKYWQNVGGNLTSIGAFTVGLVFVQTSIKQGLSEQALSAGLSRPLPQQKYDEHAEILHRNAERQIVLPYFLHERNRRETQRRKREFLIDNGFTSEEALKLSKKRKLIKKYNGICTNITSDSIRWATTEIIYDKHGRIMKLPVYRRQRMFWGVVWGVFGMVGAAFIAGGLFLDTAQIPFTQKLVQFLVYLSFMAIPAVLGMLKDFEKGAFGVPNELSEINNIWREFELWSVPEWVLDEVKKNSNQIMFKEDNKADEKRENTAHSGAALQEKPKEIESIS